MFATFSAAFFLPFPLTHLVMDEDPVGAGSRVETWDRADVQLCFGHWVSIPTVEGFQEHVILLTKLFSFCSVKVALSVVESMDTLRAKGGTKVPLTVV